ncbi:unnamed protein product, partial [Prorocentrum cordatum]
GPPPPAARAAGRERSLTLHAWEGDVLGAALGMTDTGAVILNIREGGLLDGWNEANPKERVYPGLVITGVNGARGYWAIVESLKRPGVLTLTVSDQPPPTAGPKWFEDIAAMGRSVVPQEDGPSADSLFSSLPNVVAGDGGVDQCSICLDDIGPDEVLVELPRTVRSEIMKSVRSENLIQSEFLRKYVIPRISSGQRPQAGPMQYVPWLEWLAYVQYISHERMWK